MFHANAGSGRRQRCHWRRWLVVSCATLAIQVILSACGAAGTIVTTPTHTPTPGTSGHGVLYAFATNLGSNGPTSTDVYALGLGDGKQVWHTQVSGGGSSATLGGGTLYLGTYQNAGPTTPPTGTLQAFNANTGAPLWHHAPPAGEEVPIAANSDAVFAITLDFSSSQLAPTIALTALRAADGTPLWTMSLGQTPGEGVFPTGPTLGANALYLVTQSPPGSGNPGPPTATLTAVDISTGKTLWNLPLASAPSSAMVLSGGVLYLAEQYSASPGQTINSTSVIQAVDASDGKVLWSKSPTADAVAGELVVTGQTVCYSYGLSNGPGGGIVVLHASDGGLSWQTAIQAGGPVPIAADSGAVYALESTKSAAPELATTLNVFDSGTGRALLTKDFPPLPIQVSFQTRTPLQVANGVLYVVGSGFSPSTATQQPPAVSIVLALNTQTGTVLWQQQFNGSAQPDFLIAP